MKFVKSAIVTFITNICIFSISLITTIVTSRLLGPTGKGVLSVSNTITGFSVILLGFGIAVSNVYFIGRDRKDTGKIVGVNFVIAAFSAVILSLVYLLTLKYNFKIFKGLDHKTIAIVFSMIPFMILKSAFLNVLLGMQEVLKYNKINLLDRFTTLIFLIIFIIAFKTPYWVVFSNFIAVMTILGILSLIVFCMIKVKPQFDIKIFKEMIAYGMKAQFANIIQLLNYRLDVFIINYFLPTGQVGIYTNAVALGETMWQISGSIGTVVFPMTTNSKDKRNMKEFINKVTRVTFTIIVICAIMLIIISKPLILLLLGKDFAKSATALVLIIPGITVFSISNILSNYIAGIGKIEKNIIASVTACIVTVSLDFILIPRIGINGASIASSISYTVFTMITLFFYTRMTQSKLSDLLIIKKEDIQEVKARVMQILKKRQSTNNLTK